MHNMSTHHSDTFLPTYHLRQGIAKGQVRNFIDCMASDLELEIKNGMVEALRLTEPNPSRLLRFVKQGGLMKLARASEGSQ